MVRPEAVAAACQDGQDMRRQRLPLKATKEQSTQPAGKQRTRWLCQLGIGKTQEAASMRGVTLQAAL